MSNVIIVVLKYYYYSSDKITKCLAITKIMEFLQMIKKYRAYRYINFKYHQTQPKSHTLKFENLQMYVVFKLTMKL